MIPTYCPECGSSHLFIVDLSDGPADAYCRACGWAGIETALAVDPQTEPAETVDQ